MIHPTIETLRRLRLTGMAKALEEQQNLPDCDHLSFAERLAMLPTAVVILLVYINPHFYDEAWTDKTLAMILAFAGVLLVTGILLLRHFVKSIR